MKKTNNNSPMKRIAASATMLAVSAAMLGTSTYAWFTMNKEVQVTNMQVKAKAEKGLLINEVATATDSGWDDVATAKSLPGTALVPTSTKDSLKWWHANSKTFSDEAGSANGSLSDNISGGYAQLTGDAYKLATTAAVGDNDNTNRKAENNIFYYDIGGSTSDSYEADKEDAYYVMYKYYLKASNEAGITLGQTANAQNVAIKRVLVTENDGDADGTNARSTDLNKALRVGVKIGGKMYIYAPVYGAKPAEGTTDTDPVATYYVTDTYTPANGDTAASVTNTAVKALKRNEVAYTALGSLPGASQAGTEVDIYIWFEGEDDNCQSDKITTTLDNISVDVVFGLETLSAAASFNNNEFAATAPASGG